MNNDGAIPDKLHSHLTPFSRSFSPVLFAIVENLQAGYKKCPETTYTTEDIRQTIGTRTPWRVREYLRMLYKSGLINVSVGKEKLKFTVHGRILDLPPEIFKVKE